MLWGGRFSSGPHPEMLRQTVSLDYDMRLLVADLAATRAHARALVMAGLLDEDALPGIDRATERMIEAVEAEAVSVEGIEDVHSLVERFLTDELGDTGSRIHAGRSRNDLVATDLRLWCRDAARSVGDEIASLIRTVCDVAEDHVETVMPGYTHLQRAQPVSLAFHLCAHGFALARDLERFLAAEAAADVSALGAGALAGNTLGLDPSVPAGVLGFTATFDNAMDAVSDRDFALDLLYACAVFGVHLSRLAEEIVLWTSAEFGFARLDDAWSTGSSMMPQKRNPDMAELLRGRSASGIGDLTSLLGLLKGLPLAYDRDLQEDKEIVFRAVDRVHDAAIAMRHVLPALSFDVAVLEEAAGKTAAWATDVAEWLVRRQIPFREAHHAAGRLVSLLESSDVHLDEIPLETLRGVHPALTEEIKAFADPRTCMEGRTSAGGTAPERVREQIAALRAYHS